MQNIMFPKFSGIRCLMMPYIQGDFSSVSEIYMPYKNIIESVYIKKGDVGFLTIDESDIVKGAPHRGSRAKYDRAIHTEAGRIPGKNYQWGGGGWGAKHHVTLDRDVKILLSNNIDDTCAIWNAEHEDTSLDGDIGHVAEEYPYSDAIFLKAGEVHEIGILTPHESLPVKENGQRQFLRIISSGVHGSEPYFTKNPLVDFQN